VTLHRIEPLLFAHDAIVVVCYLVAIQAGIGFIVAAMAGDLPPLNGTTSRERIWGWSKPREATNATRKEGTG
ncbi:MAG: hypothetical protein NTY25_00035, partial [Planctomycetia bacterium]|nr:hypothetical protein [Planctomycetia bacterium]